MLIKVTFFNTLKSELKKILTLNLVNLTLNFKIAETCTFVLVITCLGG